jgi:AraC-like DNA-binding protein
VRVDRWAAQAVRLERYTYGPGRDPGVAPHAHPELQVCFSADGAGHVRLGRSWEAAEPGKVYVFPPNMEHTGAREAHVHRPAAYDVLYLDTAMLGGADSPEPASAVAWRAGEVDAPGIVPAVRRLIATLRSGAAGVLVEDAAAALLARLAWREASSAHDLDLARSVRDILHASPTRCPSLARLASAAGASVFRVRSACVRAFGVPPVRYHLLQRLQAARSDLIAGLSPSAAALRHGFADQAHLSRKIRRYFGHTPASIRPGALTFVQDAAATDGVSSSVS